MMKTSCPFVTIRGCGSALPDRVVTNEELEKLVPTSSKWIVENLGIRERRRAADGECTSDLAAAAALRALDDARIAVDEVGLIIVATATPDRKSPSTACIVQNKIGMTNMAPAFDLSAVCSGFLFALNVAGQFLESSSCNYALVIGADTFSSITDWSRRDCVFFGDGAGAVVLGRSEEAGIFASRLYSDGRGQDNFTVHSGDRYFSMNGTAVYETATRVLPQAIRAVLLENKLAVEDVSWVIPHQPSIRILEKTAEILDIPFDRVKCNMDRYANTSGGTIPILLDEVKRAGALESGNLLLMAAVGSGWTWGATAYRWR